MSIASEQINRFLSRCRRRLLLLEGAAGAFAAGDVFLGVLLLSFVVFQIHGSLGGVRTLLLWALSVAILVSGFLFLLVPFRRWRNRSALAKIVDQMIQGGRLDLVSAVELQDPLDPQAISPSLVDAHLERMAGMIQGVRPAQLFSARRVLKYAASFATLSAVVVSLLLICPESFGASVSTLFQSKVEPIADGSPGPSWLGDIRLSYRYPAYSGREDRLLEGSDGSIQALPGTEVRIASRADRDLESAAILWEDGRIPLTIQGGREIVGQLVVMKAGSYRFELDGKDGDHFKEDRLHPILLEVDRSPEVMLSEPPADRVVREKDSLDLKYEAKDDFGLSEVRLVYKISNRPEGEQRRSLKKTQEHSKRLWRESYRFDLAGLNLLPGEQVQLYVEAADNDTVLGPKLGRSATRSLKVFSAEEEHRGLMQKAQALWEKLLVRLADNLENEPLVRVDQEEKLQPHQHDYVEMEMVLAEFNGLILELGKDRLAWTPLVTALRNVRLGWQQFQNRLRGLLDLAISRDEPPSPGEFRILAAQRGLRIERLERDVLYLEDLLDLVRLEELDRMAKDLEQARDRLAQLMEQYQRAPDEETRKKIESEIARLKAQVAQLLARQSEVLKGVQDEYYNPEALKKLMSQRDLLGALDRVQNLMMEGKLDQAMAELNRLDGQMKQLRQAIDRSRAGFGAGKYAQLGKDLARLMGEINQVAQSQKQVMEQTGRIRQKMQDRLKQRLGADLKKTLSDLRQQLAKMTAQLKSISESELDMYAGQDRSESLDLAKGLDQLLKSGDIAGSLETADKLTRSTDRLDEAVKALQNYEDRSQARRLQRLGQFQKSSQQAKATAQSIYQELKKLFPRPDQLLGEGERNQMQGLLQQQQGLEQKMREARQEMDRLNAQAPLFGQEMMGGADRGRRSMNQASNELGRRDARGAYPHQQSAMSELERLGQSMKKCTQGSGGGSGSMPLPMGQAVAGAEDNGGPSDEMSREKVEIPGPEDFKPPEAFRQDLLEGMKDPVPDSFKPQVRKYYEELVK